MRWWIKKQLLRLKLYAEENYQNEAESLLIWYAVCFALGVAFYFAIPYELPVWSIVVVFEAILLLLYLTRQNDGVFKLWTYVLLMVLGLSVAKVDAMYRINDVEKDIIGIKYLRGKIKVLDYNSNNRPRFLLTDVNDFDTKLKGDFKVSFSKTEDWMKSGKCVELIANLAKDFSPNPLNHSNFSRRNFYQGISAIGYTVAPIFEIDCEDTHTSKLDVMIDTLREKIATTAEQRESREISAIIKALTIGDKSEISKEQTENYRLSGLAHFLAISGMHMGMIALLFFFIIRAMFFMVGNGQYDLRKPAAIASLTMILLYFLLSGQSVSCMRAFIMTSLILLGILFNRRAISLRMWAFALLIVAIITPSAVLSAGFLMSFSAVLGLVSFYENREKEITKWFEKQTWTHKIIAYFSAVILTDLIASLMTLPYSLYYFHQISIYTTLGNLLAAPVIAFWVMPALLLFLISFPLGLESYAIKPLGAGIDVMNQITHWVSSLRGARTGDGIGLMPEWGIFVITLGILWLCIWQERWRYWGIIAIICGLSSIWLNPTADFVFDEHGTTFAYRDATGKLVATPYHKNRYLINIWTNNQSTPNLDETITCSKEKCVYKNRIEFGEKYIKFDGKDIPLNHGGYINLNSGVHDYIPEQGRLWN